MRDIVAVVGKIVSCIPDSEQDLIKDLEAFFKDMNLYTPPELARDEWKKLMEFCKTHIGFPDKPWKEKISAIMRGVDNAVLRDVKEG